MIPAHTEVSLVETKKKSANVYANVYAIGLTEGGSVSFEPAAEPEHFRLNILRPQTGSWSGKAFAVMTPTAARALVEQMAQELGLVVLPNAATIAKELKA